MMKRAIMTCVWCVIRRSKAAEADRHRACPRRERLGRSGLKRRVEVAKNFSFCANAGERCHDFAIPEKRQRRDGADVEARGEIRVCIDVDLRDRGSPGALGGNFLEARRDHFARAAPLRPKVDEDRVPMRGEEHIRGEALGGDSDGGMSGGIHVSAVRGVWM